MVTSASEFLAHYSPAVQIVTLKLCQKVNLAMPGIKEALYERDNHFGYSFTGAMRDRIVYICPMTHYVRLGFMWGSDLPDPEHLLVGDGKRLRHVRVRSMEQADSPALEALLCAAWEHAVQRQAWHAGQLLNLPN